MFDFIFSVDVASQAKGKTGYINAAACIYIKKCCKKHGSARYTVCNLLFMRGGGSSRNVIRS